METMVDFSVFSDKGEMIRPCTADESGVMVGYVDDTSCTLTYGQPYYDVADASFDQWAQCTHYYSAETTPSFAHFPPSSEASSPCIIPETPNTTCSGQDLSPELPDASNLTVSSTFHFENVLLGRPWDTVFISADNVYFTIHSDALLSASTNGFGHLLPERAGIHTSVSESSPVLNLLLHAIYHVSAEKYAPRLEDIEATAEAMSKYGIEAAEHLEPNRPLHSAVLSLALRNPLPCFAFATSLHAEALAVAISPYLLTLDLSDIPDPIAARIGPMYLKRLFYLHLGRTEAFKRLLLPPPGPHPPTEECDLAMQRSLLRAWVLAVAYLSWEPKAGMTNAAIESVLIPLAENLSCSECKNLVRNRVKRIVIGWSLVKRTI